jgi:hypothetical protein
MHYDVGICVEQTLLISLGEMYCNVTLYQLRGYASEFYPVIVTVGRQLDP